MKRTVHVYQVVSQAVMTNVEGDNEAAIMGKAIDYVEESGDSPTATVHIAVIHGNHSPKALTRRTT